MRHVQRKETPEEKVIPVAFAAICVLAAFFPIVSLSGGEVNVWMNISNLGGLAYLIGMIIGFFGILISVPMKKKEPVEVHLEQTNP